MLFQTVFACAVVGVTSFNAPILPKVSESKAASAMAAIAALTLATAPALAGDKGARSPASMGESVFTGNCYACHALGRNIILPEKTLQLDVSTSTIRIRSSTQSTTPLHPPTDRSRTHRVKSILTLCSHDA